MGKVLKVLIVEDSEDDTLLTIRVLKKSGYDPEYMQVETAQAMSDALREKSWDIILCDYKLPTFSGVNAIALWSEANIDIPLIVVSGAIGEETAVECMKSGAHDYIMKDNLSRLVPAIERELDEAKSRAGRRRAEEALRESEVRFRTLADSGQALIWTSGIDEKCDYVNQPWLDFTGHTPDQELGDGWMQGVHPDDLHRCMEIYAGAFDRREKFSRDYRLRRHDGEYRWIQDDGNPRYNSKGEFIGYIGHCLDITDRKQTEANLRESEGKYRTILKSIEDGYYEVDLSGSFTFFNDAVCRMLGYSKDELTGMNFRRYMDKEHIQKALVVFNRVLTTGKAAKAVDWKFTTKDGSECFIEASVSLMRDREGKPAGFQGIARDVSERKQAEEEIRHISAIQNLILENSTLGIALVRNRTFEWVNARVGELLMLPLERIQGESCRVIYPSDEAFAELGSKAYPILAGGERSDSVLQLQRSDGSLFWCRFIGKALDPAKPQDGSIWMFEDITERKQAEEMLRNSEEKYRNIFENAVEGIFQSTPDGQFISVNPAFAGVCGFNSSEEMINTTGEIQKQLYVHPEDRARLMELLNSRNSVNNYETEFWRRDGAIIWVSINVRTVRGKKGNIMLLEGTITDITERKKAQSELQKKNLELAATYEELRKKQSMIIQQEKMASIGMLAAGIAHEIKNPLAIVLQGIGYLQTAVTENLLMIEVVERMNKAIIRADIIVKGLLSYARQEVLSLSRRDIPKLIDESLVLTAHEFRKKNLQLIKQYAPGLPEAVVDGGQLKQVFVNLLLNGSDAMTQCGIFTINVRQIEDDGGRKLLEISFKDTGHGITADNIHKIFDPFYTTKDIGNTGLGLSISKGIIENHGGVIYAESQRGQGTNFIIHLPIQ
jgi:PAS domain S-box-containing protein